MKSKSSLLLNRLIGTKWLRIKTQKQKQKTNQTRKKNFVFVQFKTMWQSYNGYFRWNIKMQSQIHTTSWALFCIDTVIRHTWTITTMPTFTPSIHNRTKHFTRDTQIAKHIFSRWDETNGKESRIWMSIRPANHVYVCMYDDSID